MLGWLLDKNWDYYFYFMAPFGILGGLLMFFIRNKSISSIPRPLATQPPGSP